jgi:diacylglycerol kinase family enzyme
MTVVIDENSPTTGLFLAKGALPMGTFNHFAKNYGISLECESAALDLER